MVLFTIHLRPHNTTKDLQTQLIGTGIHAQEIRLKAYFVHFKSGGNSGVQIPNQIFVDLNFLGNQVHNASSPLTEGGSDFPHINSLILPLQNELFTGFSGLDLAFSVDGKIDRDIVASVRNFDSSTPTKLINTLATTSTPGGSDLNAYLTSVVLMFEYDKVGNF
tara:strand:- start:5029 stop:5520 length:492 start_codon:yes stop_codon:yes gene_type:complete